MACGDRSAYLQSVDLTDLMQLFETGGVVGREVVVGCGGPARVRAVGGSIPPVGVLAPAAWVGYGLGSMCTTVCKMQVG